MENEAVDVRYIVDDVARAVVFYTEHFGFNAVVRTGAGFAMLARGRLRLLLNEPGAGGAGRSTVDGRAPRPGGWNRIQLRVDDLDSQVQVLRRAGVPLRGDIVTGRGGRQILVEDPAGNLIELFEPAHR